MVDRRSIYFRVCAVRLVDSAQLAARPADTKAMTRRLLCLLLRRLDASCLPPWHPDRVALEAELIRLRAAVERAGRPSPRRASRRRP